MTIGRRSFLIALGGFAILPEIARAASSDPYGVQQRQEEWAAWKEAFLASDGRVIDHLQEGASHSEGQGYGLLLSVHHGDRAAFDLIRSWTEANLMERPDGLLNWRRDPGAAAPEAWNATDGDIFYAWALSLGANRFDVPEARSRAQTIATAVAAHCLYPDPRDSARLLILPAAEGFLRGTMAIVNPSYIMPRALHDLALLIREPRLAQAAEDGLSLLDDLAAAGLTPDWAEVDAAGIRPSSEHQAQSGYDALRVPLYLIWSGQVDHPAVRRARELYAAHGGRKTPVVCNLAGDEVCEASSYQGFQSLSKLVLTPAGQECTVAHTPLATDQGYYPATLDILCRLVATETAPALRTI